MNTIPTPSITTINKYLEEWNTLEKYTLQEQSLGNLFHLYCPKNNKIENILLKVSALNDFYSTNIFDTYTVAKHILSLDIDTRLKEGDYTLVNDMASVNMGSRIINFYSFASKYCSHHNPELFPIYDSYVEKMLKHYRKIDKFYIFKNNELKSYPDFINIIKSLKDFYQLDSYTLRELDIFLWLAGKQYMPNNY